MVGDMLEQKHFGYDGFDVFGRQSYTLISADIEISLHLISISTQPNDLPTSIYGIW